MEPVIRQAAADARDEWNTTRCDDSWLARTPSYISATLSTATHAEAWGLGRLKPI